MFSLEHLNVGLLVFLPVEWYHSYSAAFIYFMFWLNYSPIPSSSLTNHLIHLLNFLNHVHVFSCWAANDLQMSSCSAASIFLTRTCSILLFSTYSAIMMFLSLYCVYSCWPIWAQQHVFGCSMFSQSELHRPTSLLLPAIGLKCRLVQALLTTCVSRYT